MTVIDIYLCIRGLHCSIEFNQNIEHNQADHLHMQTMMTSLKQRMKSACYQASTSHKSYHIQQRTNNLYKVKHVAVVSFHFSFDCAIHIIYLNKINTCTVHLFACEYRVGACFLFFPCT